jgi:hypothetical protein
MDGLLKIKHRLTHNHVINEKLIPVVKAVLCHQHCNFKKLSPAFTKHPSRTMIDPQVPFRSNEKILICGWPKAGNTWLQALFADYFSIPMIQPFLDHRRPGVANNHFPPGIDILYRQDIKRCLFIVRDLRDIICSYYHYAATPFHLQYVNATYDPTYTIDQFYHSYFLKVLVRRYKWQDAYRMYSAYGVPILRYEDLLQNTVGVFSQLLQDLDIFVDKDRLMRSVDSNSFKKLKAKGVSTRDRGETRFPDMPTSHFRKGTSGGWKEELPEAIQNDIAQRFGKLLSELGYEV